MNKVADPLTGALGARATSDFDGFSKFCRSSDNLSIGGSGCSMRCQEA